jgi:uncharacterized protein YbjT (DUF2867 family)
MILVTGATGRTGSQIVRELCDAGLRVRAFVRDPEKGARLLGDDVELAVGDLAEAGSLRRALDGVDQLVLSCADDPRRVRWETAAIAAAAASGVRRVVRLSTIGARPGAPVAFWDWHGRVDDHLRASGIEWAVLQSSFSMANLLAAADQIAADGRIYAPAGSARIAMIHPRDVGASAAAVLAGTSYARQTLVLTGPEAITYEQVAGELATALGRAVSFVDVPPAAARDAMLAAGLPELAAEQVVAIFGQLRAGVAEETTETVAELTGRRPRSFSEFARDFVAYFTPVEA